MIASVRYYDTFARIDGDCISPKVSSTSIGARLDRSLLPARHDAG